ncbi:MAG: enoyl-CoA hydratase-related protein [Cyclobacteriaceae bacterium]|jgi:methylglutaconyl-CoA hydratase|nr:enoyl-CoA hydratase-related protein [Cyclobacteriaceae bacterium]
MELVRYSLEHNVCTITMNRPDKRNALNPELIAALRDAFKRAETDSEAKVVILAAEGEAFCAGADLAYLQRMQGFSYEENLNDSTQLRDLFWQIYSHPKVIIARIQGPAIAGGCGLVSVCDFSFATGKASFGYTEVKIGFVPALVMSFLVRKIGEGRARQLLLTGTVIDSKEAYRMGLINCVSEKNMLTRDVETFATSLIKANSFEAMKTTKQLLAQMQSLTLEASLDVAAAANARARETDDCKRGISAFLNKEKIDWNKGN